MKKLYAPILLLLATIVFASCASKPPSLDEQILGTWQGSVQGFDVTLIYDEEKITVDGFGMSFPYSLQGNEISMEIPGQGTMKATVEIDGDQMTQTDINSGEQNVFTRKI